MLYGHKESVCLIGASEVHAQEMPDSTKLELDANNLLEADFPDDGQIALGARGFHAELVRREPKYLEHQCSEISDALGHWAPVSASGEWGSGRRPNHFFDCAYMQFALADIVRMHLSAPRRRTLPVPQPERPPIDYAMM